MKSNKRLLFCPKCNTEMHILELTLTEKNIIKYKCQCGILSEEIESFLSKNTYYFTYGSSYEFSNKSFINELNNQFLNLNLKAPKCHHGNEITGFCDTCSEYLCEKCMHKHLTHIIFDTNNIKCEIDDLFPDSYDEFMTSLEQNHSIIISQINSTIEQLQSYKELIEKEYNNTVNKNKILYEIAIRLKNNYDILKKIQILFHMLITIIFPVPMKKNLILKVSRQIICLMNWEKLRIIGKAIILSYQDKIGSNFQLVKFHSKKKKVKMMRMHLKTKIWS